MPSGGHPIASSLPVTIGSSSSEKHRPCHAAAMRLPMPSRDACLSRNRLDVSIRTLEGVFFMIQSPYRSRHLSTRFVRDSSTRNSLPAIACLAVLLFSGPLLSAQGPTDDLSRPQQGRSPRRGRPRARPTTRRCCSGSTTTETSGRGWWHRLRPWGRPGGGDQV